MRNRIKKDRGAFVSWADFMGRSQGFIDNFDMIPIYLSRSSSGGKAFLPLRYIISFFRTLKRLYDARPGYVIVMCPPIFAALAVYLYVILTHTRFVVDVHSGALESRKWKWSIPILRMICRKASLVMVTNIVHFEAVKTWGANPKIVGDPPPHIPGFEKGYTPKTKFISPSVIVVNSYSKNEGLEETIDAARNCSRITFYVTGDTRKADAGILAALPGSAFRKALMRDSAAAVRSGLFGPRFEPADAAPLYG